MRRDTETHVGSNLGCPEMSLVPRVVSPEDGGEGLGVGEPGRREEGGRVLVTVLVELLGRGHVVARPVLTALHTYGRRDEEGQGDHGGGEHEILPRHFISRVEEDETLPLRTINTIISEFHAFKLLSAVD